MSANHAVCLFAEPGFVTELHCSRAVESAEQRVEKPDIQLTRGRKLQQDGTEMIAQGRQPPAEDAGEPDSVESLR